MTSVVRGVLKAIKEKGFGNFLRELKEEGYTKCLLDGNLLQTKIHNMCGGLVGIDKFGNKYYENMNVQHGQLLLHIFPEQI
ncbi:hypothetical protein SAY87_019359 [Trapa incisa]|uniref:NADH dehydrogenase [ubiquinone] 1 alpha subcomplex subunit 12 n=1 Tax=Trapa incisa TaxID=236973 RepID=A0AAN7Q2F0_9MYRT|nr:hypothetical protein SAY87_019359 [Trapa incisa]